MPSLCCISWWVLNFTPTEKDFTNYKSEVNIGPKTVSSLLVWKQESMRNNNKSSDYRNSAPAEAGLGCTTEPAALKKRVKQLGIE